MNKRAEELINAYCSGNMTDREFLEFEDILREDAEARKMFVEYRSLDTSLRSKADAAVLVHSPNEVLNNRQSPKSFGWVKILAAAAIITALISISALLFSKQEPLEVTTEAKTDDGKAVLMRSYNAVWNREIQDGDSLPPGELSLKSGIAELEFYGGASVILKGPAIFSIIDGQNGRLSSGNLRAYVPSQAHGFTIETPDSTVVDLGTSFGLNVDLTSTSIEVFKGEVEVKKRHESGIVEKLTTGKGIRVFKGRTENIELNESAYSSAKELSEKISVQDKANYDRWQERVIQVKNDSRLLARYNFTEFPEEGRLLQNTSSNTFEGLDGAIVGARWAEGRWRQKSAIEFKRPGDCIRVEVPGSYESVSLTAWIRIDGLDNTFNSLILSNGWRRAGAFHWQIGKDDFVELAVWNDKSNPNSRAPFKVWPSDLGRWMHVAVVYNGREGTVTHYRNGKALKEVKLRHVVPIEIGKAQIGNWYPPEVSRKEIRNLNGRMDDFAIYSDALTSSKVLELYKNSKP